MRSCTKYPSFTAAKIHTYPDDLADEDQLALLLNASLDQVHNQLLNYSGIEKSK